ncbi:MAG TPA: DUF309 domain-containing protein [Chthoniobacterales bacterium]|nr:DUF309 domain-containing protein [Chthoniobacterales bacterium]
MNKGERISRFVQELEPASGRAAAGEVAANPFYRAFFRCWNEQRYYEAHDVLEHIWLDTTSDDANYFKGLIQAAGGFVHLQHHYQHPTHRVHGRRLKPAVRLFHLAERNLAPYSPSRHGFDVAGLLELIQRTVRALVESNYSRNPWSPENAPKLSLNVKSSHPEPA